MSDQEVNRFINSMERIVDWLIVTLAVVIAIIAILWLTGCGGSTASMHPDNFPAKQALHCVGDPQVGGGQLCDESDGSTYYRHDQFSVVTRADGHGTFSIVTELGVRATGLRQIDFRLPHSIYLHEIHGTLTVQSWCDNNGALTGWDSYSPSNQLQHLTAFKGAQVHSGDISTFTQNEVEFEPPLPTAVLENITFTDLCSRATYNWVLDGSF